MKIAQLILLFLSPFLLLADSSSNSNGLQSLISSSIPLLNPEWSKNEVLLSSIQAALCSGRIVQIRNAINRSFAERLQRELRYSNYWQHIASDKVFPVPRSSYHRLDGIRICERLQESLLHSSGGHDHIINERGYHFSASGAPIYSKQVYQYKMFSMHNKSTNPVSMTEIQVKEKKKEKKNYSRYYINRAISD